MICLLYNVHDCVCSCYRFLANCLSKRPVKFFCVECTMRLNNYIVCPLFVILNPVVISFLPFFCIAIMWEISWVNYLLQKKFQTKCRPSLLWSTIMEWCYIYRSGSLSLCCHLDDNCSFQWAECGICYRRKEVWLAPHESPVIYSDAPLWICFRERYLKFKFFVYYWQNGYNLFSSVDIRR